MKSLNCQNPKHQILPNIPCMHTHNTHNYTTQAHTGTQTDLLTYIRDWLDINTPLHLYMNIHTHAHISELFRHITTCCRYCNCNHNSRILLVLRRKYANLMPLAAPAQMFTLKIAITYTAAPVHLKTAT